MDFRELLKGVKTKSEFNNVCENWYARLNRLKSAYQDAESNNISLDKQVKFQKLIDEMISRMITMSSLYVKVNTPPAPKGFQPGGFIIS